MKFLVPNYSCLQNPWLGGYRPQILFLCPLSSTEFVETPEQNSWVRHWAQKAIALKPKNFETEYMDYRP